MSPLFALLAWLAAFYTLVLLYHAKPQLLQRLGIEATLYAIVVRKGYGFEFVDKLGERTRRLLRRLYDAGVLLLVLSALLFYQLLVEFTARRVSGAAPGGFIVPLIPGVTISINFFLQLLPVLGLAAAIHELSHGIASKLEGIPVRSTGIMLLLGIIPAAFVEPIEEAFRRARLASKLRVLAAGVAANILVAAIALSVLHFAPHTTHLVILGFTENSPAKRAGLEKGDVILYVNGTRITSVDDLRRIVNESRAVNLTVRRDGRLVNIVVPVAEEKGRRFIGVYIGMRVPPWVQFLTLTYIINLSLAMINAAPLFITDGGRALHEALSRLGRSGNVISVALQAATLALIALNVSFTRIG